ncbi:MAG: threonyl-tRNA synthetase [Rickettsiaceae bacterium]|jgi:threonyl-tRNA synthetase|nr:threonyl-tRNA synthetase [Rickettsiaceae bacterium]
MINITFPDGSIRQYPAPVTGIQIAESISKSLAKDAYVISVDGELRDLSFEINNDAIVRILTHKNEEVLEVIRHDAAHLLAEAVKELYPETQVTIGPAIENGFYYDFARDKPFSLDDLAIIEAKMHEISKRNESVTREVWSRDEAVEFFKSIGEHYKAEIISSIPANEDISLYRQGNFIDLCRGPHAPSTGKVKYFKLMKIAGAYWRGDSKNQMLQRIYGTAWGTEEQLKNYLFMLEEAEKRDHRKLGRELDLFHFQEEAQGIPFWHDKGWTVYRILENYIRNKLKKQGYKEVRTPILLDSKLWKTSGHLDKFNDNMFYFEQHENEYAMKPMNCPCHIEIFKQGIKSYRDLPLRMAEFGTCHRYEPTGSLHGLMRVRSFAQDDAHIFCTEEQITEETVAFCKLLIEVYNELGFKEIKVKFSDRPEKRAGTDEIWDKAENSLKAAVEAAGLPYILNPGEGAFYGPKLEFALKDAIGREWQCGTIQADFVLPDRLDANYITPTGEKRRPVMLHRAILGSLERFIGILIEEYSGKFPLWLAPTQVAITTITSEADEYAKSIFNKLNNSEIRTDLDISAEKINYKVRNFSLQKVPLIAVVGLKEAENGTVSVRRLGSNEQTTLTLDELIKEVKDACNFVK